METEEDKGAQVDRLRDELKAARERVALLESKIASLEGGAYVLRQDRRPLEAEIEFIGDFDVVKARGIDLSEGGICFELDEPLLFDMRFTLEGQEYRRNAHLVWMRSLSGSRYRLGLKFLPGSSEPDF